MIFEVVSKFDIGDKVFFADLSVFGCRIIPCVVGSVVGEAWRMGGEPVARYNLRTVSPYDTVVTTNLSGGESCVFATKKEAQARIDNFESMCPGSKQQRGW